MILERRKVWEIRGENTKKRGWIHLTRTGAGGVINGSAKLVDVHSLTRRKLADNFDKHRIRDLTKVKYAKIFAWEFKDARTHHCPFTYDAKQGPVKFECC